MSKRTTYFKYKTTFTPIKPPVEVTDGTNGRKAKDIEGVVAADSVEEVHAFIKNMASADHCTSSTKYVLETVNTVEYCHEINLGTQRPFKINGKEAYKVRPNQQQPSKPKEQKTDKKEVFVMTTTPIVGYAGKYYDWKKVDEFAKHLTEHGAEGA